MDWKKITEIAITCIASVGGIGAIIVWVITSVSDTVEKKKKKVFGWQPRWHMETCMEMVCQFSKVWLAGGDIPAEMDEEIEEFIIKNS